jgi:molybdenum cofactor synthesis domain-containing protein
MKTKAKKTGIILVGNEILSGKIVDKNAVYLTKALRDMGVTVERIVVIPDQIEVISEEIKTMQRHFDLIFVCGGIGPTHDDVTMQGLAEGLDTKLIRHSDLIQTLKEVYGPSLSEAQMRMADVPKGTHLVHSEQLRVPVLQFEQIYIFPGIPELVVKKFEAIKERFRELPFYLTKIYLDQREVAIAHLLEETLHFYPKLLLGSYPILNNSGYKILLTLESKELTYLQEAMQHLLKLLPESSIVKIEEASA